MKDSQTRTRPIEEMDKRHPRMAGEARTVAVMIELYCRSQHSGNSLCSECTDLLRHARERLDRCPFQEGKTTCAKCAVHCFEPTMRDKTKAVMRYSGPRMIHKHPVLAMLHFVDGFRKEAVRCH